MQVEVLFFAQLRDAFGKDSEVFDLNDGGSVQDALDLIAQRGEWAAVERLPIRYAVNEVLVDASHALSDGDRLALLTPVSGG